MSKRSNRGKPGSSHSLVLNDHDLARRIVEWSKSLLIFPNRTPCWIWCGYTDKEGYGEIKYRGKKYRAIRVSYASFIGPITAGNEIDHICLGSSGCVNPRHLQQVDPMTNQILKKRRRLMLTEEVPF